MRSYKNSIFRNKNLIKDLFGISLILAIGIGGFLAAQNPVPILVPEHPMLSADDWSGSHATRKLSISDAENLERRRDLHIRLNSNQDANGISAEVSQSAIWLADPKEAMLIWNEFHPDYSPGQGLVSENLMSREQPISRLYCENDLEYTTDCMFYAYRGHWFTWVQFLSKTDEHFSTDEIMQITTRANQLLMSVSDEQVAGTLPIRSTPTSLPYVFIITAISTPTQPNLPTPTPNSSIPSTPLPPISVPTLTNAFPADNSNSPISCMPLQRGETRFVPTSTFILGDIIIDGVEQYDSNIISEGKVTYLEKASLITAPQGADCFLGNNDSIYEVVQNELQHGCGSKCASVRFVLVQSDGQHVEIYKYK